MIHYHHEENKADMFCLKINTLITILKLIRFLRKRFGSKVTH